MLSSDFLFPCFLVVPPANPSNFHIEIVVGSHITIPNMAITNT